MNTNNLINDLIEPKDEYDGLSAIGIYLWILNAVDTSSNLAENRLLMDRVGKFFAMQMRGPAFVCESLRIVEKIKKNGLSFNNDEEALNFVRNGLRKFRNFEETSFASKVLHLADNKHEFIIYDSLVKKALKDLLDLPKEPKSYYEVKSAFLTFKESIFTHSILIQEKDTKKCHDFISEFGSTLKQKELAISLNKTIDFYLWGKEKFK